MKKWHDDPFTKKAKKLEYLARSVFKLSEIDKREGVFQGVSAVLDLGASPGSWTQYSLERIPPQGHIVAVDAVPMSMTDKRVTFLEQSVIGLDLSGAPILVFDLVLSDLAPKTTGVHESDTALSFELACSALQVAEEHLKPCGTFVVKLFMGEDFKNFQTLLKKRFSKVRILRPDATRKHSREIYFVAKGYAPLVNRT